MQCVGSIFFTYCVIGLAGRGRVDNCTYAAQRVPSFLPIFPNLKGRDLIFGHGVPILPTAKVGAKIAELKTEAHFYKVVFAVVAAIL